MAPNRADRILAEWSSVAHTARPPAPAPVVTERRSGPGISLLGAAMTVLLVVVALAWLGNREEVPGVGGDATPPASQAPTGTTSPNPSPNPSPTQTPAPAVPATATPAPAVPATATPAPPQLVMCDPSDVVAQITLWEGAAGSRIADVQLTNTGQRTCSTPDTYQPTLVDGNGAVLIEGDPASGGGNVILQPQDTVTTLVRASNYCGPDPKAPVMITFSIDGGNTLTARPISDTDATVPPCNGPGTPGTIEMQPWQ